MEKMPSSYKPGEFIAFGKVWYSFEREINPSDFPSGPEELTRLSKEQIDSAEETVVINGLPLPQVPAEYIFGKLCDIELHLYEGTVVHYAKGRDCKSRLTTLAVFGNHEESVKATALKLNLPLEKRV